MSSISNVANFSVTPETIQNEVKNIFRRPLKTSDPRNTEFGSLKGRAVCVLKFGQALLVAPIKMLRRAFVIVSYLSMGFMFLLGFDKAGLKEVANALKIVAELTLGAAVQPLSFVSDITKLAAGAIIHPKIAIGSQAYQEDQF